MDIYDFINSDDYKKYIERNHGVNLYNTTITTDFIQRFIESEDKTRLLNLGYSVFLKHEIVEDGVLDYYYKPYIVLEKVSDVTKLEGKSITMTKIKRMTHDHIHNSNIVYTLDYTYIRECDKDKYVMPDMPFFVGSIIDMHMKETEKVLMNAENVNVKSELYKVLPEKIWMNLKNINNELELFKILSKEIKILDSGVYSINPKFDTGIYVKAQDKDQHNNSFNDCHYFKINRIGARYCCNLNQNL